MGGNIGDWQYRISSSITDNSMKVFMFWAKGMGENLIYTSKQVQDLLDFRENCIVPERVLLQAMNDAFDKDKAANI